MPKEAEVLKEALNLYVGWTVQCDFGYDNIYDLYEKYKDDIEPLGYSEGLVYIAIKEAEEKLR